VTLVTRDLSATVTDMMYMSVQACRACAKTPPQQLEPRNLDPWKVIFEVLELGCGA